VKEMRGTKTGKVYKFQSDITLMSAVEEDSNSGFCIFCGDEHYGIEPDAKAYKCESCQHAKGVYGAEQLIVMGLYYSDGTAAIPASDLVKSATEDDK
jgi:hypothetical protein